MPTKSSAVLHLEHGEVALFGYGSLLNFRSFERTYGRPYTRERYMVELPGWRRVWNSLFPNHTFYFEREPGGRCYPENILYLNVRPAADTVNGLLYAITEEDLAVFDQHEETYDRMEIRSQIRGVGITRGPAYMYVSKPAYVLRENLPKERAAIRQSYLEIVEQGLTDLGPEFRAAYEACTDRPAAASIVLDRSDEPPGG